MLSTCLPTRRPLLLLTEPNVSCHPGALQHLRLLLWWLLLWGLGGKRGLSCLRQYVHFGSLCQHTRVLVTCEHIPSG
jgi:hypothetical protein